MSPAGSESGSGAGTGTGGKSGARTGTGGGAGDDGPRRRVAVVGAGVTGLSLVHHCRERGVEAVAYEASDRPGGVVRTDAVDGHLLERGPHRIRRTDAVAELVAALGLEGSVVTADDSLPLYVYRDGALRAVPRSLGTALRTDLLSWRGKLRALYEPLTAPADPGETVAELFTRKFGPEVYRYVVEPLFGGIYASDPAEMPVRHSLSRLVALEEREGNLLVPALRRLRSDDAAPPISFEDGMATLTGALYREHADRVRLSTPVDSVAPADDGGRWRVEADGETRVVDDVVVTAPAAAAADVLDGVAPDAADRLRRLRYNPIAMVYLDSGAGLRGFGYQVAPDEDLRTRGVTFVESLFGRERQYTAFFGGMSDPEAVEEDDATLAATAVEEFRAVTGAAAEAVDVHRLRAYPAHDASWAALDGLELPEGIHLASNYTARIGVPGRVREAREVSERLAGERAARVEA